MGVYYGSYGNHSVSAVEDNQLNPVVDIYTPMAFQVIYYGVFMPAAFVGNLLTCLTVGRRLLHHNSVPCVLVGGLALNDLLTCIIVFLPSVIAEIRGSWFPWHEFSRFHTVTTVWYLYTTFAIVVLMSVDRWIALVHPYYYVQHITTLQMKLVVMCLGAGCLLLGGVPMIWYPVALRPGWYCTVAVQHVVNNTLHTQVPTLYVAVTMSYLALGLLTMTVFTGHTMVRLTCQKQNLTPGQRRNTEQRFAKLMAMIGVIFMVTWLPSLVSMFLCLWQVEDMMCHKSQFWSSRIVNMGVAINPIVYGVMKRAYRRGYLYWVKLSLYTITCTIYPKPTNARLVFGDPDRIHALSIRSNIRHNSSSSNVINNALERKRTLSAREYTDAEFGDCMKANNSFAN